MQMNTDKGGIAGHKVGDVTVPVPAVVAPLIGLAYILLLPFAGVAAFILACGYRIKQRTTNIRVNRATTDVQEDAGAAAVDVRDSLQSLIDGLGCEFMVVDRELRITQYRLPQVCQNELPEQTAIGKHCYEVSHGRNKPCQSPECECPVRKVLETHEKTMVTHYHQSQIDEEHKQKLVKVLASPIRDNWNNITQVAEIIWDTGDVEEVALGSGKR
jgi:hypothetical protein